METMKTIEVEGRRLEVVEQDGKLVCLDVTTLVGGDYAVNQPARVWVREDQVADVTFATLQAHSFPSEAWLKMLALNASVDDKGTLHYT